MWCRSSSPRHVGERDILQVNPTVAGTRVELAAKRVGQIDGDRAVAGIDFPVPVGGTAVLGSNRDAAVAATRAHAGQLAGDANAAVAGIGVHSAGHIVQIDRPITGVHAEIAGEAAAMDAAVARPQIQGAGDPGDRQRPVAAAGPHVGRGGNRHDQVRRARAVPRDRAMGCFHVDDHAIAVLFGADFDRGGFLFVSRPLFDDDEDLGPIPGAYLDRSVKGGQAEVRPAAHRKPLLVALDVSGPGAGDLHTPRSGQCARHHHGSGQPDGTSSSYRAPWAG